MSKRNYLVGDEVEFFCKKCRLNLYGNVASILEGEVETVTCRTCRFTHPYVAEKSEAELRASVLKRAFAARDRRQKRMTSQQPAGRQEMTGGDVTQRWREATEDVDSRYALPYDRYKNYEQDDILIDKQNGLGMVSQVLHEHAILVLFRKVEVPLEMNAPPSGGDDDQE